MKDAPVLDFNREFGRWSLRLPRASGEASYEMLIDVSVGEPHTYRFIRWSEGEWWEIVSAEQHAQRIQTIRENEGDAVADLWALEQEQELVLHDTHPVFALARHWDAMMQLELFQPAVTYREWKGRPMSPELSSRLDALRDEQMKNDAYEYALWENGNEK